MKNLDLQRLMNGFDACAGLKVGKGGKFGYAIAMNVTRVEILLACLRKTIEPDDGYKEYNKARIALCEEYATKDKHGKAMMYPSGDQYVIEDFPALEAAIKDLQNSDEHKEAVDRHEEKLTEHRKLLEEDADYEPHMISLSKTPEDITTGQLVAIREIVKDDGPK